MHVYFLCQLASRNQSVALEHTAKNATEEGASNSWATPSDTQSLRPFRAVLHVYDLRSNNPHGTYDAAPTDSS